MGWGDYLNYDWGLALLPGWNGHHRDILDPEILSGSNFILINI
jgi:hypothetical protein